MKKITYTLIFILSLMGLQAQAGIEIDRYADFYDCGIGYVIKNATTRTIEVTILPDNSSIGIPDSVVYLNKTFIVKSVADNAMYCNRYTTDIYLPTSIDTIAAQAFLSNYTDKLNIHITDLEWWCNLKLESSVCRNGTLYLNKQPITDLVIPNSVTKLGDYTFSNVISIKTIDFNNVTSIGKGTFSNLDSLTSITIPQSIEYIGDYAFSGCKNVTSLAFRSPSLTFGNYCFSYCTGLTNVDWGESDINIAPHEFSDCRGFVNIVLSDHVKSIGNGAFNGCSNLETFETGNGVESVGDQVFVDCKKLSSLKFGDNVSTIGAEVANQCVALTDVKFGSKLTSIGKRAFYFCYTLDSIEFPSSVTHIGDEAFMYCSKLTQVKLPTSLDTIPNEMFMRCTSLKTIDIPSSVTVIGSYAFGNTSLSDITIPNSVKTIQSGAFYSSSLSNLTLGSNVQEIGDLAFFTSVLGTITSLNPTPPSASESTFATVTYAAADLNVPAGSVDAYKAATGWKNFASIGGGAQGDTTTVKQCATPEISYAGGKLSFTCATEGAKFYYTIEHLDNATNKMSDGEVTLQAAYKISVYAAAPGYTNSETATATINLSGPTTVGDVDGDNKVDATDLTKIVGIILGNE